VIVNVSSVGARTGGGIGALAYCSAKGAINTMTRGLAREFGPHGIRVNAVSPGTVDTNYHRNFSTPAGLQAVAAATPMSRIGTPGEIAAAIVFLCTSGASFIHGEILEINGGFFMG
jgi:3-oxoacyl-[acyl-carrier protein] reductase